MDFSEKLSSLRKQKKLTQEELAAALFVSRTAVSKWESGRGYPSIDSLIAISKFFGVSIDDLLTGDQVLTLAKEEQTQTESRLCARIFGLLDLAAAMFFFLPFFAEKSGGTVKPVSLMQFTGAAPCVTAAYFASVLSLFACGLAALALQSSPPVFWARIRQPLSLLLSAAATLLFIVSPQPYAAAFLFVSLLIKSAFLRKKR